MNKITKIKMGISLSILAFSLAVSTASAQTCGEQPTCESLGYVYGSSDCKNVPTLTCPFDSYYKYCASPSCPDGFMPRGKYPWTEKLSLYTGSRNTSCVIYGVDMGGLSELIDKCGKHDNGFGMQDIFSYAAREQGILGSGTWDTSSGKMIVILAGPYQPSLSEFTKQVNNDGYAVVDVGPYAGICNSANSSMKDTAYGLNLNNVDLKSGEYIVIRYNNGKAQTVYKSSGTMPTGSSIQVIYQDGYYM
ncbi:MAG: hypothetical protein J6A33_01550 [Alphaproteobacteria bacterium]|nr:hypothetical protein [Alphaproteobacteria bacterium]